MWERVSMVVPDLLDTMNSVSRSGISRSRRTTASGWVVSRIVRPAESCVAARTSGARLEPPIPRTRACRSPSARASSATPRISANPRRDRPPRPDPPEPVRNLGGIVLPYGVIAGPDPGHHIVVGQALQADPHAFLEVTQSKPDVSHGVSSYSRPARARTRAPCGAPAVHGG